MGQQRHILAVDLGTSAAKLALVSERGVIAGFESRPLTLRHLPLGGVEQRPADWWAAVEDGTRALVARGLVPKERITAVSVTSQWSGTVPVDEHAQPLCDAIIWMDSRGARNVRAVNRGLVSIQGYGLGKLLRWVRLTGGVPGHSGKDSLAHILYLRDEHPALYARTHKFLEPMDWLNARFTGKMAASQATITLTWCTDNRDLRRVAYHDGLLKMMGVAKEKLPELRPPAEVLGPILPEVARSLGLGEHVQVVMGTPDIHTAAVGSGAVRDGEAHISLGTSSWLCCHVPSKKSDLGRNMASLPSAIPGRYLLVNEQECAGACLTWLRDSVFFANDGLGQGPGAAPSMESMIALARDVPAGSDRLLFAPWMNGERSPVDDPHVRGAFFNQSLHTTRAHMVRAVLEGVAFNTRWLKEGVEKFVGRALGPIAAVGGGAESAVWCQILADVLERPIKQAREPLFANVRGAGLIGSAAMGYLSFDEVPALVPIARVFEPTPAHRAVYDRMFREYLRLYDAAKDLCGRLNR